MKSERGKAALLSIFDSLRAVTMASITLRMLLSVLCGGLIGIEREYKRRPAGFRTHILICLGAAHGQPDQSISVF